MNVSRRSFLASIVIAGAASPWARARVVASDVVLPRPTPSQLLWQRDELAMFVHFGVNTYTDREWGLGNEDPAIFNPTALDARQWARSARAAGARAMILTAKHHDGFCLFPTKTTKHSVESSPWRGGKGDVVREFADACRAENLRVGLYCSPWDRNSPTYGGERYNDFYCDQLTELLTRYGDIHEMWFDGANGEGPNGKRQSYDWPRIHALVRKLQPNAVMFSDAGPDVRWCGNEKGMAGYPNWASVDPAAVPYPGVDSPAVTNALLHGDPAGRVWRPAEADVSIRPGWFHHAAEDDKVKSVDALNDIWFNSVGHNSKLLLNVPPTRKGLFHANDVARLREWRESRNALFAHDLAADKTVVWRKTGERSAVAEIDLGKAHPVGIVRLSEDIERGQRVSKYVLHGAADGDWKELTQGETIGACKLDRIASSSLRRLRVTIEDAISPPLPLRVAVYPTTG
ncbi:alpha-L-fucosidase [Rudaea cellulosilytica]|uniref:alpha-L-fucosidase n=1 Tax=Rudaea cellulosilytica TaxID=540746 RepID=UPI00035EC13D|nr:alpha-L-fucosidase [Rudaea cellulosilytica]